MILWPGGNQPSMQDAIWGWQVQKMVTENETPKGMKMVLEERGINMARMNADDMRIVLANHEDLELKRHDC